MGIDADILFIKETEGICNVAHIVSLLIQRNLSPHLYVRLAFKKMISGDYDECFELLDYAAKVSKVYYKPGMPEKRELHLEIIMIRITGGLMSKGFSKTDFIT